MTAATGRPLDRAKALAPLISADAQAGETLGRLTDEVARAMLASGLFSMLVDEQAGGLGAGRAEFFETVETVARADGAAGWCLSVCSAMNDFLQRGLSAEGRAEVFGDGPVACWASLLPRASALAIDGGYRLTGTFNMGSGSSLADWVTVSEPLPDRGGRQWFRAHVVPKREVTIEPRSWDVMGLRGTASIDYRIEDRFVPARRTFEYPFLQGEGGAPVSTQYGVFLNQIGLTAFASGVAQRAMAELAAAAPKTRRLLGDGVQADDTHVQFGVGEIGGRMQAARAHFLALVAVQDRQVAELGAPDPATANETSLAAQTLTRVARELTIFAFDNAGAGVIYASHPIQRCLRDIFTGLKHAAFTPAILTRIGRAQLGVAGEGVRIF